MPRRSPETSERRVVNAIAVSLSSYPASFKFESFKPVFALVHASSFIRTDVVESMKDALERFKSMEVTQIQNLALELAMLGNKGLNINDATKKHQLQSWPGEYPNDCRCQGVLDRLIGLVPQRQSQHQGWRKDRQCSDWNEPDHCGFEGASEGMSREAVSASISEDDSIFIAVAPEDRQWKR
jgi:hypothetical protein